VFISYSWESAAHKEWVRSFAARLRGDGVKVTLDQWYVVPGDQLPEFMEREIGRNKYVLIICTPHYKKRADKRVGGVGYEGDIMTAEVLETKSRQKQQKQRKFIPILRAGSWEQSAPSWLQGKCRIHLAGDPYPEEQYQDLLATLHDARPKPPPLGPRPEKYRIEELRRHFESPDADERFFAIKALGGIGPAAAPALAAALKDDDARVRRRAAEALVSMGPAAAPTLVAALKDGDAGVRWWAAEALQRIGPGAEAAVPALAAALEDGDALVRRWAADTLGRIGPGAEAAVPALVAALEDGDAAVRRSAAGALRRIGPASSDAT
jgi:hypothetical protein